ncbi:chemotaxis protein [Teredinibacter sp. KSP-S5-2]|uniref:chemotaxis protein n=1 Tax=Teredinibacter sp. KSP-S5-2 TaxID=3034506 RepID=UPI0029343A4F|nr:chemotaxis protein [Teredinibacter sp. KSP-S5-2]WNO10892.1 chemotaxis protein [Teredinibacter sp. KSP-S5-2]
MKNTENQSYFVVAAIVAAELHKAMKIANEISLTASNARALALRAGQGAAGFRAITDFIDELARVTVSASQTINRQAILISRMASDTARAESALARFNAAIQKAEGAKYVSSIDKPVKRTRDYYDDINKKFTKGVWKLTDQLNDLARELRTATVLSAMSRVEASQSGKEYEQSLNVVAENVARAAEEIQHHVKKSQSLFNALA